MLRRNFTKALPIALAAPTLLVEGTSDAASDSPLRVIVLEMPYLTRDELPMLSHRQWHVLEPDGTMLSSAWWRYSVHHEDGSVTDEKSDISFANVGVSFDDLRDHIAIGNPWTIELRCAYSEGTAYAFVPENELDDIVEKLSNWNEYIGGARHHPNLPQVVKLTAPIDHGSFIYAVEQLTLTRWIVYASNQIDPSREIPGYYDHDGWLQARAQTLDEIRRHVLAIDSTAVELRVQCTDGIALAFVAEKNLFDVSVAVHRASITHKL